MKTISLLIMALLTACSSQPPKPLRGEFSAISPEAYQKNPIKNLKVRWTGFVVDVENKESHSCLTIMAKVPDQFARPSKRIRVDQGRFIACKPKFLEPAFFLKKAVTVTGPVKKIVNSKIDEMTYPYPLVDAQVIYVW
ncbi:Slp family lipoprotein [Marinicella litoralis]|uniref:Starvation-inducible outer membrane lipoprotein n=1 Tax=Marinicella litoralis TaxID=644220 RepID=A0A4R6XKE1_9GAMM|nr:Slp family lipoprotein [Marinicella litoralis]TDR18364.1 starvation-inducible outer membrane lipoprotein [Marinicella litoralis]